jgi:hypothetical protein
MARDNGSIFLNKIAREYLTLIKSPFDYFQMDFFLLERYFILI